MKKLENLINFDKLNIKDLFLIKGGANSVAPGCTTKECKVLACVSIACSNYSCNTQTCTTSGCNNSSCSGTSIKD
jgi:hypothetical protein